MSASPTSAVTASVYDVKVKRTITFTYKRSLTEYVNGSPVTYVNDIEHNGVISLATEEHIAQCQKIAAIKQLRTDNEGLGLKEAKDVAEAIIAEWADGLVHPRKEEGWKDEIRSRFSLAIAKEVPLGVMFTFPSDQLRSPDSYIEYVKGLRHANNITLKLAKDIADAIFSGIVHPDFSRPQL